MGQLLNEVWLNRQDSSAWKGQPRGGMRGICKPWMAQNPWLEYLPFLISELGNIGLHCQMSGFRETKGEIPWNYHQCFQKASGYVHGIKIHLEPLKTKVQRCLLQQIPKIAPSNPEDIPSSSPAGAFIHLFSSCVWQRMSSAGHRQREVLGWTETRVPVWAFLLCCLLACLLRKLWNPLPCLGLCFCNPAALQETLSLGSDQKNKQEVEICLW